MAYYAKFTERGQRALLAAQKEAAQLGRTYVGTEHLLLGVRAGKLMGERESEILRAKVLREELKRLVSD